MARADNLARLSSERPSARLAIALVGPGRVGSRLLERLIDRPDDWQLCALANSRILVKAEDAESDLDPACWPAAPGRLTSRSDLQELAGQLAGQHARVKVVVDATASEQVARHHAGWLESGLSVVTANKWALAAPTDDHRRLAEARSRPGVRYECAATVGAGLPVFDTVRRLHGAGETVHEIKGALSGTMTCLISSVNSGARFSRALALAHAQGVTEPDPRHDLDGVDVARKLVILAREAGIAVNLSDVHIDSLLPPALVDADLETFLQAGPLIDDYWGRCVERAPGQGRALCFTGRIDSCGHARVGLERVSDEDPFARLTGADNRVEIRSACYRESPLVIQGPGAGIEVTALALWSGLSRISECAESGC
jgi:homoserine dehydrogenase